MPELNTSVNLSVLAFTFSIMDSTGENRLLLTASPICCIMAGLKTSKEDQHLYP
ncbi:hypothetical protein ACH5RR_037785, partial [Cinchona calisaya]